MKCNKQKFSLVDAKITLFNAERKYNKGHYERNEKRYYFCKECKAYHLTSKDLK